MPMSVRGLLAAKAGMVASAAVARKDRRVMMW
jgi:hypothetical protein